jgi:hypothetical protein
MIAAFIGSKLLLMGGVGRYRLKLSSIDIYDVHTGENFSKTFIAQIPVHIPVQSSFVKAYLSIKLFTTNIVAYITELFFTIVSDQLIQMIFLNKNNSRILSLI